MLKYLIVITVITAHKHHSSIFRESRLSESVEAVELLHREVPVVSTSVVIDSLLRSWREVLFGSFLKRCSLQYVVIELERNISQLVDVPL